MNLKKFWRTLPILVFLSPAFAQRTGGIYQGPATRVFKGNGVPSALNCTVIGDVGKVYIRQDAQATNSSFYTCDQTGSGVFGWELAGGGAGGTVTTFSAGTLSPLFTTTVANPTTTPALSFSPVSQSQNLFFASPNGSSGNPGFRAIVSADLPATNKVHSIGAGFDGGGSALSSGATQTVYFTVPFACTISAWNITVDTGTITFDVWKIATGTAIPTVANTIVASAAPAIASGTAIHSTTLTGWTTSVVANDIFGVNINTVASATKATLVLECDQ